MADQVHCYFFMLVPPDHDTKALIPTFTAVLFFNFDSNATAKLLIMTRCQSDIDADFVYKFLIFAISLNLIERGLHELRMVMMCSHLALFDYAYWRCIEPEMWTRP